VDTRIAARAGVPLLPGHGVYGCRHGLAVAERDWRHVGVGTPSRRAAHGCWSGSTRAPASRAEVRARPRCEPRPTLAGMTALRSVPLCAGRRRRDWRRVADCRVAEHRGCSGWPPAWSPGCLRFCAASSRPHFGAGVGRVRWVFVASLLWACCWTGSTGCGISRAALCLLGVVIMYVPADPAATGPMTTGRRRGGPTGEPEWARDNDAPATSPAARAVSMKMPRHATATEHTRSKAVSSCGACCRLVSVRYGLLDRFDSRLPAAIRRTLRRPFGGSADLTGLKAAVAQFPTINARADLDAVGTTRQLPDDARPKTR